MTRALHPETDAARPGDPFFKTGSDPRAWVLDRFLVSSEVGCVALLDPFPGRLHVELVTGSWTETALRMIDCATAAGDFPSMILTDGSPGASKLRDGLLDRGIALSAIPGALRRLERFTPAILRIAEALAAQPPR